MRTITFLATSLLVALFAGFGTQGLSAYAALATTSAGELATYPAQALGYGLAYLSVGLGGMWALFRRSLAGLLLACGVGGGVALFEALTSVA